MPELKPKMDSARLDAWREERQKVAEAERDERLQKRERARKALAVERQRVQRDTARALLPQEDALLRAHKTLRRQRFRRTAVFWVQFLVCVAAPIAVAFWYLTTVATPLYEARSVVAITKPTDSDISRDAGLLGRLSSQSDLQEVFMAHEFVQSQALMDQLEAALGLTTRFSSAEIDPLQRLHQLPAIPVTKRQQFNRFVDSSVNVQNGLLTIYVRDKDRALAVQTAQRIIAATATQINQLNDTVLEQRLSLARLAVVNSQAALRDARRELVAVQIRNGEVDPQRRVAGVYDAINAMEAELQGISNEISRAEIAGAGQGQKAQQAIALRDRLSQELSAQKALLVAPQSDELPSLNAMLMEFDLAKLQVDLAQQAYSAALVGLAEAEDAGVNQRSVFQVVVPPRTASQAMFPRTPTLLALVAIVSLVGFAILRLLGAARRNMV